MKIISIIGATISGNRGAEAMLTTVIGRFREMYPDAVFNIFSYYPDEDRKLCGDPQINVFSATPLYLLLILFPLSTLYRLLKTLRISFFNLLFPRSLNALATSNVLIDIAGVSFMDGRAKFLPYNILTILPAMLVRTPVVKFAQALGTFTTRTVYWAGKLFLPGCTKIFARGASTEENLRVLGFRDGLIDSAADLAFLHHNSYSLTDENPEFVKTVLDRLAEYRAQGKTIVGLCPSSVIAANANREGWNYVQLLADVVHLLHQHGCVVILYPNATREKSQKLRNNDLPVIDKTARYLAARNQFPDDLFLVTKDVNTVGIKEFMAMCDVNIVSRFHAMVGSLSLCRPLVVMGWGHKYQEVMNQFDLAEYVFDYKNKTPEQLVNSVLHALEKKQAVVRKIHDRLPEVQAKSAHQFTVLHELLDHKQ